MNIPPTTKIRGSTKNFDKSSCTSGNRFTNALDRLP